MFISEITLATTGAYDAVVGSTEDETKWNNISNLPGWSQPKTIGQYQLETTNHDGSFFVRATKDGQTVATLQLVAYNPQQKNLMWVDDVMVRSQERRSGLATFLYDYAVELGVVVVSGIYQTPSSRKLWLNFIRQGTHTIRALETNKNRIMNVQMLGRRVLTQFNDQIYSREHTGIQLVMAKDLATIEASVYAGVGLDALR